MLKVIINFSFGSFQPKEEFAQLIKERGYESLWSIEARTDEVLVKYVEDNAKIQGQILYLQGITNSSYVTVRQVDTSRPWYIESYDNQESIGVVDYKHINKDLNFVEMLG